MNTVVCDDLFRTRNPLKELVDLERRLAAMLGTREPIGHGGKEALTVWCVCSDRGMTGVTENRPVPNTVSESS